MPNQTFFQLADLGLSTAPTDYVQSWLTAMQSQWPNYAPRQANQEYLLAQIFAAWASDSAALASYGATDLFRQYGIKLIGLQPLVGQAAQANLTISTSAFLGQAIASTSSALSTSAAITEIPVTSVAYDMPAGDITLSDNAGNTQVWSTTGTIAGATEIPVASQTPNFAYPAGSAITGTIQYTLPVSTQFDLDGYGFQTLQPYDITAGTAATVPVYALEFNAAYNGAGADGQVSLISNINWVTGVTMASGGASGGIDPEDSISYLNRLANTLQTMAQRPITAQDYETIALNFEPAAGTDQQEVGRAAAIDGARLASPVERTVYLYVTDVNGNPLNSDTLTALTSWLENMREANFVVNVSNASYQPVYVTVTVSAQVGYNAATVKTNVQNAVVNYLSPTQWGSTGPTSRYITGNWATNTVTIYQSQLETIIQNMPGVDHVIDGQLFFGTAANPTNTTDLALPGTATLPVATTATVTVNTA